MDKLEQFKENLVEKLFDLEKHYKYLGEMMLAENQTKYATEHEGRSKLCKYLAFRINLGGFD